MALKIFLDDFRKPSDCVSYMHQRIGNLSSIYLQDWEVAKNYEEFVKWIIYANQTGREISHVSFDHDLADGHYHKNMQEGVFDYEAKDFEDNSNKTGFHCAKWMKKIYENLGLKMPIIFVHSMNPVGTQNIINVFT